MGNVCIRLSRAYLPGAAAIVLGSLGAAPAFAQDEGSRALPLPAATGSGDSADIVVTARRVEERLQDVPVAIAVVSQQQLANRNVVTAADLTISIPSLTIFNPTGSNSTTFSLRGFGQSLGTDPSVGVYFADAVSLRGGSITTATGNGAGPGQFFDLQNVQVLKGPQGTLFGRNSTGGAILLMPQKPTANFGGYAEGSYGNYDMYRVQAVLNVPLGDSARMRLGVDRQRRDGYLRNLSGIGPSASNDVDYVAARASLVVDLTPDLETYTIASYLYSNTNGDNLHIYRSNLSDPGGSTSVGARLTEAMLARYGNANNLYTTLFQQPTAFLRQETWQIINNTSWRVSDDVTLRNILMYGEFTYNAQNPGGGTAFELSDVNALPFVTPRTNYSPGTIVRLSGNSSRPGGDTDAESTFSEEFRLEGSSFGSKLKWQAGAFFEYASPIGFAGQASRSFVANCDLNGLLCAGPIPSTNRINGVLLSTGTLGLTSFATRYRTVGIYTQGTYQVTDRLGFTVGARYNWARETNTTTNTSYSYPYDPTLTLQSPVLATARCSVGTLPDCSVTTTVRSQKPTGTIGLDYKPTDDILTYAKWSRGFRQGGLAQNAPAALRTFKPETVDAYEIGLKSSFRGPVRGTFNVAAFYNKLKNQQLQVSLTSLINGAASTAIANAGSSRVYGVEVDTSISLVKSLTFDVNYAYLQSRIESIPATLAISDANYRVSGSAQPGDPLLFVPKHKIALTASYTLPLDESLGGITLSATYTYTSKQAYSYQRRGPNGALTNPALGTANGPLGDSSIGEGRSLADANLTWKRVAGSHFDLSVFGSNIFNKKYAAYIQDVGVGNGYRGDQVGLPRLYGMRVRYNF